ncbi:SAP domain-containing ribonucleoprotein-like [Anguilla rostrata]|uniref:SAP domain-containing ribonucleoprotein-like n=1 Tax=Anguilla rostrata TaxID=7938 RepID=UPI0030D177A0
MAEVVELQKLKLAELKQECAARGLSVKGNKAELIARLQEHESFLEEHEEDVNEEEVLGEETEESAKTEAAIGQKPASEEAGGPEGTTEKKVVKITPPIPIDERLQKRAERFNVPPSADSKKAMRAARFGLPAVAPVSSLGDPAISKAPVDVGVLKKRAERFGMNVSSISKKVEEDEKLKKRKERFGGTATAAAAGGEDSEAKKRKRAERFGNV